MATITEPLAAHIRAADPNEDVVVILEMAPQEPPKAATTLQRQQLIAARRAQFEEQASPIEQTIQNMGGEVLDRAWINNTMKARVPARAVKTLIDVDGVETVDIPHRLQRD